MFHALILALVYALILQACQLLHSAMSGWSATRALQLDRLTVAFLPVAATAGLVFSADLVTAGVMAWPGWRLVVAALGVLALVTSLLLYEWTATGRYWRTLSANPRGLLTIGIAIKPQPPALLGLGLSILAGMVAPPPSIVDWLPLACLAVLVLAQRDRPPGRTTRVVLLAWFLGLLVGGLEHVLAPGWHALALGLMGLLAARLTYRLWERPTAA